MKIIEENWLKCQQKCSLSNIEHVFVSCRVAGWGLTEDYDFQACAWIDVSTKMKLLWQ